MPPPNPRPPSVPASEWMPIGGVRGMRLVLDITDKQACRQLYAYHLAALLDEGSHGQLTRRPHHQKGGAESSASLL